MTSATDHFVETPNGRLFARACSPADHSQRSPIVLMHDSLGSVELWRDFHYEYEPRHRHPIDVINGGPSLREWVDDAGASIGDWERALGIDEEAWMAEREPYLIYR